MARKARAGEAVAWALSAARYEGDDCLLWPFSTLRNGYGAICIDGKVLTAHRHVCTLAHGIPPHGMQAAHGCGNRLCCNPRHLRWATRRENEADKLLHDTRLIGERVATAKLTRDDVLAIQNAVLTGENQYEIASRYGVAQSTISRVASWKRWEHLKPLQKIINETRAGLAALEQENA